MRQLEHSLIRTRSILRRAWSRAGVTDPEMVAPSQLVLRMDDADLPGAMGSGKSLTLYQWQQAIAEVVAWIGPVPVTVIATHNADDVDVPELVRFAHRLECSTRLVTDGTGITEDLAGHYIACGLDSVRLVIGGVSELVQRQTVGNSAVEATGALAAFHSARLAATAALDIEVAIPWIEGVTLELSAVVGWARQAGADGFRIVAPYHAARLPADPELLDGMVDDYGTFCRNTTTSVEELHTMVAHQDGAPGIGRNHSRRRTKCPVGGQRLVIGRGRSVYSCPFHAPIGELDDDLGAVWAQAGAHLSAIASCSRACVHTELAPQPIFG
jgi:hypothetical protein